MWIIQRGKYHSEWFQRRFNNFDSFLGTSLEGLGDQATEFLLAVEAKLKQRAEVNKLTVALKARGERFKRAEGVVQFY